MKMEAIEILKEAYGMREEHFGNPRFVSLYHKWQAMTGYKQIDGEEFLAQVRIWGRPHREREKWIEGKRDGKDKHLFRVQNTMLDPSNLGSGFVEKHREDLMRRMFRGSRS